MAAYRTVAPVERVRFPPTALTLEKLGSKGAPRSVSRSNLSAVCSANRDSTLLSPSRCRASGSALTLEKLGSRNIYKVKEERG